MEDLKITEKSEFFDSHTLIHDMISEYRQEESNMQRRNVDAIETSLIGDNWEDVMDVKQGF